MNTPRSWFSSQVWFASALGLFVGWGLVPLQALGTSKDSLVVVRPVDPDRTAWAANATYHTNVAGRLDHVLALRFLRQKYSENPQIDPLKALLSLNRIEKDFAGRIEASKGNFSTGTEAARTFNEYVSLASGVFSIPIPAVSALVKGLVGPAATVVGGLYDSQFGPLDQVREQIQISKSFDILGAQQFEEWGEAHDLASLNPRFAEVIDSFFGARLRASVRDSASEIHAKNPAYSDHAAIREILVEARNGSLTQAQAEGRLAELQKSLGELLAERRQSLKSVAEQEQALKSAEELAARGREAAEKREIEALESEALRAGWNTLGAVIAAFDARSAQALIQAGDATFRIADAFSRYSETATRFGRLGSGVGTLVATSNIVHAAFSLSALWSGALSTDELMLGQIRLVRKELGQLKLEMGDRFDRVDRSISELLGLVNQRFDRLDRTIQERLGKPIDRIERAVSDIQGDLFEVANKLDRIEGLLISHQNSEREAWLQGRRSHCRRKNESRLESLQTFKSCVNDFSDHARRTPPKSSFLNADLDRALLERLSGNVSFLAEYSSRHFGISKLSQSRQLPDFVDWANGAMEVAALYEAFPDYWKVVDAEALDELLDSGAALGATMKSMLSMPSVDGPLADTAFFRSLMEDYRGKLDTLQSSFEAFLREFETQELAGYSLEGPNTSRLPAPKTLPACGSSAAGSNEVAFPEEVLETLPASIRIAEHLVPGTLRLCYQAEWSKPMLVLSPLQKTRSELCMRFGPVVPGEIFAVPCTSRLRQEHSQLRVRILAEVSLQAGHSFSLDLGRASGPMTVVRQQGELCSTRGTGCFLVGDAKGISGDLHSHVQAAWSDLARALHLSPVGTAAKSWSVRREGPSRALQLVAAEIHAESFLENLFSERLSQFKTKISDPASAPSRIREDLKRLSTSRRLIESLIALGLPESMASNDELVSYFKGSEGLLDGTRFFFEFRWGHTLGEVLPAARERLVAFEEFMISLLQQRAGKEDHPLISRVMDRLGAVKSARNSVVPRRSISEARRLVLEKVAELQRK